MDEGHADHAEILDAGTLVDEDVRRALDVSVSEGVLDTVEQALAHERARAATFFDVVLGGSVGASFVRYLEGGHYLRHRDRDPLFEAGTDARLVTVVVWLNSADSPTAAGAFAGGTLRLIDPDSGRVQDLLPTAGTLVAFPAEWPHEVRPVTRGTRDVVVDWWL